MENHFSYFSTKTYVVVTKKYHLIDRFIEHPKHMFKLIGKKNTILLKNFFLIWTYVSICCERLRAAKAQVRRADLLASLTCGCSPM